MTPPPDLQSLRGLRVSGIVPVAPRSLALAFGSPDRSAPRAYLWLHFDRKEAALAWATELPIAADPRGSRFGGLETPVRGLVVVEAVMEAGASLRLELAPEIGAASAARLTIDAGGKRSNLVLRSLPDETVLWALHRDEVDPAEAAPPGFHPARLTMAGNDEERDALRARINASFREDFERELRRSLDRAEQSLARRIEALEGDRRRARERLHDRRRAEILLAHLHEVPRGASRVGLPDPYADSPGSRIEIELDPRSNHGSRQRVRGSRTSPASAAFSSTVLRRRLSGCSSRSTG